MPTHYGAQFAVDLKERDWAGFAEALGAEGIRAETADDIRLAAKEALRAGRPALIHVPVRSVISPFMDAFEA